MKKNQKTENNCEDGNTIRIMRPQICDDDDGVLWKQPFSYRGKDYAICNKFSANVKDALLFDRIDAAVIALLRFAIKKGADIVSDVPISEELAYNIHGRIDSLCNANGLRHIEITVPTIANISSDRKNIVATGISCGVDSLYTVSQHLHRDQHSLTHLAFFDVGAHLTKKLAEQRRELAVNFSKEIGLPLITIDSNLPDILNELDYYNHVLNHTYMMASLIASMQGGIKYYYYSSTYSLFDFGLSIDDDCAHHDLLLTDIFSYAGTRIISVGSELNRIDKVKEISKFPLSYKYLNVCIADIHNDGVCFKCIRTLLELDAIGAIDNYSAVFDVDSYKRNRKYYLYRLYYRAKFAKDILMAEVYPYFEKEMTPWLKLNAICHLSKNRLLGRKEL